MRSFKAIIIALSSIPFILSCTDSKGVDGEEVAAVSCELGEETSYSVDVLPILENNCYECHNEEDYAKKADGHKLYGYENIKKKVEKGSVKASILHAPGYIGMPYRRQKLDTCDLAVIISWIDEGAKNN